MRFDIGFNTKKYGSIEFGPGRRIVPYPLPGFEAKLAHFCYLLENTDDPLGWLQSHSSAAGRGYGNGPWAEPLAESLGDEARTQKP
jgi:hypothetical protein